MLWSNVESLLVGGWWGGGGGGPTKMSASFLLQVNYKKLNFDIKRTLTVLMKTRKWKWWLFVLFNTPVDIY